MMRSVRIYLKNSGGILPVFFKSRQFIILLLSIKQMVCPKHKILNPCSNRCVKKTGKAGKQVTSRKLRLKRRKRKIQTPSKTQMERLERLERPMTELLHKTLQIGDHPFYIEQNEFPYSIDMSYYHPGVENLLVIHRFDDYGKLIVQTPEIASEEYFKLLYIQFVSIYGIDTFKRYHGMKLLRKLSTGVFGTIYSIKYMNRVMIIKMELKKHLYSSDQFKQKIEKERQIQTLLSTRAENHALPALDTFVYQYISKTISVILMERLDVRRQYILHEILQIPSIPAIFFVILKNQLRIIIQVLCSLDIIHGDMHWNNVYLTYLGSADTLVDMSKWKKGTVKIGLLDFGHSMISPCNPEIEFLALLRSTYNSVYTHSTKEKLFKIIYELMEERRISHTSLHNFFNVNARYIELFQKNIFI